MFLYRDAQFFKIIGDVSFSIDKPVNQSINQPPTPSPADICPAGIRDSVIPAPAWQYIFCWIF